VSEQTNKSTVVRRVPLHTKIMLGLILGAVLGIGSHALLSCPKVGETYDPRDEDHNLVDDRLDWAAANIADPIGKIFLRLMFMVVVPLVFSALSLAVVEIGDIRKLGRVGLRTLLFTGVLSLTAVVLGIGLVNAIRPGDALSPEKRVQLQQEYAGEAQKKEDSAARRKSIRDTIIDMIPENPLQEMVGALDGSSKGNGMLSIMFFALIFGAAMTTVPERTTTLVGWLEGLFAVSMTVIDWALRLAPLGAGCLIFSITARLGFDVLVALFWFVMTVVTGLGIHLIVVYSVMIVVFGGMRPGAFFRQVSEAIFVAFGTSSSNASLPTALKVAEENLRLPKEIARFVLTVGATGNQNGTALYEGVVVLFMAQVFGVDLSLPQQVTVVLMSVLAGIGTAGVPGGSLPLIVVLMRSVGIPGEGIAIILGIDRILDMCRTVLNVTGDLVVATCVAGGQGPAAEEPV
jgi:dicarboxylate/amino acid:cation (Na+ or H+) symporter, DAACS family